MLMLLPWQPIVAEMAGCSYFPRIFLGRDGRREHSNNLPLVLYLKVIEFETHLEVITMIIFLKIRKLWLKKCIGLLKFPQLVAILLGLCKSNCGSRP